MPVYRFGRLVDDTPFLVMAYVKGRTLADRLQAEGRLRAEDAREGCREITVENDHSVVLWRTHLSVGSGDACARVSGGS